MLLRMVHNLRILHFTLLSVTPPPPPPRQHSTVQPHLPGDLDSSLVHPHQPSPPPLSLATPSTSLSPLLCSPHVGIPKSQLDTAKANRSPFVFLFFEIGQMICVEVASFGYCQFRDKRNQVYPLKY